jgi:hypothetical protein
MSTILATVSDLHVGSTVALCPPDGVEQDDGGKYAPSRAQRWIWGNWLDYWATVKALKRRGDKLIVLLNGDWSEGSHHGTTQIESLNQAVQIDAMIEAIDPALKLKPHAVIVVRGTEAHVGAAAALEELAAKFIGACPDPETGGHSWPGWWGDIEGVRFDAWHHGQSGNLPYTKMNTFMRSVYTFGHDYPQVRVMIRSHKHNPLDTYDNYPNIRGLMLPSWQLSTAYGHKIAPGNVLPIGGYIFRVTKGQYEVTKCIYRARRGKVWTLAKMN